MSDFDRVGNSQPKDRRVWYDPKNILNVENTSAKGLDKSEEAELQGTFSIKNGERSNEISMYKEPKTAKKDNRLISKDAPTWQKALRYTGLALAGIGLCWMAAPLVVSAITGGASAIAGALTTGALTKGAAIAATGVVAVSCGDFLEKLKDSWNGPEPHVYKEGETYIKNNVSVTIQVTNESKDDDIIAEIQRLQDLVQSNQVSQAETNAKIIAVLLDVGISLERICNILNGTDEKLSDFGMTLYTIKETLNKIAQGSESIQDKLDRILAAIEKGTKISEDNNALLTTIIQQLNKLDKNDEVSHEFLDKILEKLMESIEQEKEMDEETQKLLQVIAKNQTNMNANLKYGFYVVISKIDTFDADVKQALSEILAKMDSMDKADQARFEYIVPILEGLGSKGAEILNAIKEGNAFTGSQLNIIIAELVELRKQTGEIGDETKTKLDEITNNQESLSDNLKQAIVEILAKMDSMDKADQERFEYIVPILEGLGSKGTEILNAIKKGNAFTSSQLNIIIAELCKLEKLTDKLGKDTLSKLNDIVTNQNSMSLEFKQAIVDILGKMDSMDKADQARFEYIVPLLEKLGSDGADILNAIKEGDKITQSQLQIIIKNQNLTATQLESLRKLIMENNNIAKGTQDAVKNMQIKLGEDHAKILKALENGNLQLNQVITLLNAIDVKETDQTVALNIIGTTLNAIYDKIKDVAGYSDEFKTLLLKILAKIPDGCKCQPTDLSAIIDLLNKLLDEVQKDPSDSTDSNPDDGESDHEGILNDLDEYFK